MTSSFPLFRRQRGVTLTELMIALVLGALVVLAATAMVVTSRGTYRTQDEATRIAESARLGLELMNRMVRLAGYTSFGDDLRVPAFYTPDPTWASSADAYAMNGPNLVGANNSKPTPGAAINGSDALTIRFYGSGDPGVAGDGNVLDCAGFPVPAPLSSAAAYSTSRAYNVLFVDADPDGEPALKCRRQTYNATGAPTGVMDTQTLIRGVESFQVLFGEYVPQLPPNANLDKNAPASIVYRTGIGGSNPVVNWDNVKTVRLAMLLRSNVAAQVDPSGVVYALFGSVYAGSDPGTQIDTTPMSTSERTRVRRVVQTTVFVRNRVAPWPQLN